ncbi:hypothetical protein SANT12839_028720 [Streptomyces antimycoticus]|uniref:Uncharacterized protein n=1 Tax=Streptomyces antimycoticus TaxID=68175 RepID=A0A4D4K4Q7_9ACTN|nr:hypothetical protein SANT12839_028720 [Streptomyces antimycoticus]
MAVHDPLLPGIEGDGAVVLLSGTVLGKQAGPVFAVAGHRDAPLSLDAVDPVVRAYRAHRCRAGVDEARPGIRACDAQEVRAVRQAADAAVAEIEPEQICVGAGVLWRSGLGGTS